MFWFTGLSGAGKTTVANAAAEALRQEGRSVRILDGDDVRNQLHRHLGFSKADILENNRLISELCIEAMESSDIIFVPIISPLKEARSHARKAIGEKFRLIHFSASLQYVSTADVKGLYKRARNGEIVDMIGVAVTNPYQEPLRADLTIDISNQSMDETVQRLLAFARAELNA